MYRDVPKTVERAELILESSKPRSIDEALDAIRDAGFQFICHEAFRAFSIQEGCWCRCEVWYDASSSSGYSVEIYKKEEQ